MKIGILTFHDEVNYGSLLQAYAMQAALLTMGHDAVVVDRWFQPDQERLYGILRRRTFRDVFSFLIGIFAFNGMLSKYVRMWRSRKFIRENLRLTPYHFHEWKDAPGDLGVDLLIVGSDQVWCPRACPTVYLLEHLKSMPAIAYAASFGVREIPAEMRLFYSSAFCRFRAIGVRELEGVRIVQDLSGKATHVVDPTLLVDSMAFAPFLKGRHKKHVSCYFLLEDFADYALRIGRFAREHRIMVEFFAQDFLMWSFRDLIKCKIAQALYPIRIRNAAGPEDFVSSISSADCVFTNSFHALMFSLIYRRNVRVVEPTAPVRKGMSARMQEFAGRLLGGPLIAETLEDALGSYVRGERISYNDTEIDNWRARSRAWLEKAIAGATNA